jgi:hypothetical protein
MTTIEIDIDESAPFDIDTRGIRVPLNFYGADVEVVCEFTAVGSWTGSDPFLARESGVVSVPRVQITAAYFEGHPLDVDGVAAAQFAVANRYVDRDGVRFHPWALSDALAAEIRDEVANVAEWTLADQWAHLLGVAI